MKGVDILAEDEYSAMKSDEKDAAKFYCTFKVHKDHAPMTAPPVRPIISSSGSVTENTAAYVEYHIKDVAKLHHSYLQDTPDLLRCIQIVNGVPAQEDMVCDWTIQQHIA